MSLFFAGFSHWTEKKCKVAVSTQLKKWYAVLSAEEMGLHLSIFSFQTINLLMKVGSSIPFQRQLCLPAKCL